MSSTSLRVSADEPPAEPITVCDSQTHQMMTVTPSFSLAVTPWSEDISRGRTPLIARGYDFESADRTVRDHPGEIVEGAPFTLAVYWQVAAQLPRTAEIILRIAGSGPILEQTYSVDLADWKTGGAYRTALDYAFKGSRYSGNAVISLFLKSTTAGARNTLLLEAPISILPARAPSTVPDARIQEVFGSGAQRLNVALRLGKGAHIQLSAPTSFTANVAAIGLISATGYSGYFDAGAEVLLITCTDDSGGRESLSLTYGKGTQHGEPKPTATTPANSGATVEIFPEKDAAGAPVARHMYVGRMPLAQPRRLKSVELAYQPRAGILDIKEIVLIPESP